MEKVVIFMVDFNNYKGKTVLVTGHTGFKGSWLCRILTKLGAKVVGYALEPPTEPSLYKLCNIEKDIISIYGDVRDLEKLKKVFNEYRPEFVFHLAAQPIVRESYNSPVYTYETNVMGTVNICECVRLTPTVKSFINVTTDKVYENKEWCWGYRENERLNGYDPYSNSKSCSELVTQCYINSFFNESKVAVSTVRAGNVIGGGDFAKDRIIPDCVRAAMDNKDIVIRNPYSIRPFQHVLEPLYVYLMIASIQYDNKKFAGFYNVGPNDCDCIQTGELVQIFCQEWGEKISWSSKYDGGPHEAGLLKLDCSKLKGTFAWHPKWTVKTAVARTVEFYKTWSKNEDLLLILDKQIEDFFNIGE